ncbi:hypothetical protein [Ruegeria atlantica]|uniref:Uncharacterized protein n=1 Tax=Ruegeria atlantica TaxID=81569 RepID=A0A0N7LP48_9RHOB|nr:hypothetical protein [Ruegeria atlantica]CUH44220.1 hypothetical protein RUM4293_03117 [Ruegeria atlantica]
MTEKVVNGRVEDVLSSIKRLVGERGEQTSEPAPSIARKPGRLVLTDALRVGGTSSIQDGPENEAEVKAGYTTDASVKPMLLRACDSVNREDPANKEQAAPESPKNPTNSLSAKIEALEAAIARTEDQWEPDGDSEDVYSGTPAKALEFSTRKEFANTEKKKAETPQPEVKEAVATTRATFIRDPNVTTADPVHPADVAAEEARIAGISEDALRKMIAEVVREELQGVLGERITRNVRKMVRREIYKALAEQDLE